MGLMGLPRRSVRGGRDSAEEADVEVEGELVGVVDDARSEA